MNEQREQAEKQEPRLKRSHIYAVALYLAGSVLAIVLCIIGLAQPYSKKGLMWISLGFLVLIIAGLFSVDYLLSKMPFKCKIIIGTGVGVAVLLFLILTLAM